MKKLLVLTLCLLLLPFAFADLNNGIVAYYKLDEITGTNAQDSVQGLNGTANDARVFTSEISGIINTGADFTQGNDYINIGTTQDFKLGSAFTLSAWINWSSVPSAEAWIIGRDEGNVAGRDFAWGYASFTNNIMLQINGHVSNAGSSTTGSSFPLNEWFFLSVVYDNGNVYYYINGQPDGTTTNSATASTNNIQTSIGRRAFASQQGFLNAKVDEVGIWSRALNSSEINELYNLQKIGFELGQYPFSNQFIITAKDSVTNNDISTFNATINNVFYSTTNGTIITPYLLNESFLANIVINAGGYFQRTYNSYVTSNNLVAELQPIGVLDLEIRNQATNNLITDTVNITLQSSTQEFNYQTSNGLFQLTNLQLNQPYTVFLRSASYLNNQYSFTYTSSTPNPFTMYMAVNTTVGEEIRFNAVTTENTPLNDVTVKVERFVNGTYQVVSQKNTDLSGDVLFVLQQGQTHRITFSKTGFITQEFISQLPLTLYTVVMQQDRTFDFVGVAGGVNYAYTPSSLTLAPSATQPFTWTVESQNADLFQYRIRLFNGSVLLAEATGNNPVGSTINLQFDTTTFNNSQIRAVYSFTKANFTIYELQVFYTIQDTSAESLFSMRNFMTQNISLRDRIVIWSIIMLSLVLILSLFGNALSTVLVVAGLAPVVAWIVGLSSIVIGFMSVLIIMAILANRGNAL